MLEVEMKFPVIDAAATQVHLRNAGFEPHATREERDRYWNSPVVDFAQTDQALRIRISNNRAFLTYKGPKRGQKAKIRTEIEIELQNGPTAAGELATVLCQLCFRQTLEVVKQRTLWKHPALPAITATWDQVQDLGTFIELEILSDDENAALPQLESLAARLHLGNEERRSYLEMLLSQPGNNR